MWLAFFSNNVNIEVKQNTEIIYHKFKLLANPCYTLCAWDVIWHDFLNNAHVGLAWCDLWLEFMPFSYSLQYLQMSCGWKFDTTLGLFWKNEHIFPYPPTFLVISIEGLMTLLAMQENFFLSFCGHLHLFCPFNWSCTNCLKL